MLRLSTKRIGLVGRTINGRACSTFSQSDRDVQLEFDMISSKAMTALQLIEGTERKKFLKLQNDKIIRADNNLMAIWMYVQLQNPLLERYRVDVPEIIKGATYAFDCAYRAISSKDLSDYAVGERDSSVSNDLLKDTMNTTLYTAFLNASKDLRAQGIDSNLTDLRINSVTLTNIHTEIVPGDVEEGTEYMSDREREVFIEMKSTMPWLKNFTESNSSSSSTDPSSSTSSSSSSIDTKKSTETEKTTTKVVSSEKEAQSVSSAAAASPSTTAVAAPTAAPTVAAVSPPAAAVSAPSVPASGEESQVYRAQPATRAALRSARANSSTRSNTVAPSSSAPACPTVPITPTETATTSTTATALVKDRHTEPSPESPAPAHTEEESTAAAEPVQPTEKELSAYPPGSVLASVEVRFDIQEEFETKLHSSKKKQTSATTDTTTEEKEDDAALVDMLSTVKNARKTSVHWTFRGCISGQVPLSWTVVAFNGMGSRNSKY